MEIRNVILIRSAKANTQISQITEIRNVILIRSGELTLVPLTRTLAEAKNLVPRTQTFGIRHQILRYAQNDMEKEALRMTDGKAAVADRCHSED